MRDRTTLHVLLLYTTKAPQYRRDPHNNSLTNTHTARLSVDAQLKLRGLGAGNDKGSCARARTSPFLNRYWLNSRSSARAT
jgi:hypothetical protein